jgi:hypothetical protein
LMARVEVNVDRSTPATAMLSRLEVALRSSATAQMSRLSVVTGTIGSIILQYPNAIPSRSVVALDGRGSTGNPTSYLWTQISGTPVTILGNTLALSGFKAPATVDGDTLVFQLTVSRGGVDSSSQVSITISPQINWALLSGGWSPTTTNLL